jgi:hypothetical protein
MLQQIVVDNDGKLAWSKTTVIEVTYLSVNTLLEESSWVSITMQSTF